MSDTITALAALAVYTSPMILIGSVTVLHVWWKRQRLYRQRLLRDAEVQHQMVMTDNVVGFYGRFPPIVPR